jgi:ankyrin repeat protein
MSPVSRGSALPPSPSLTFYSKASKRLLRACKAGEPEALQRLHAALPDAPAPDLLKLSDVQRAVAREHGLPSWPKFKERIVLLADPTRGRCRPLSRSFDYYEGRAAGLYSLYTERLPVALEVIRAWHPDYGDATDETILAAELTEEDCRLVHARQHGFADWELLRSHVAALAEGTGEPFLTAFEALQAGDMTTLDRILTESPEVLNAHGTNGNTLLNLACGTRNLEGARLLVSHGANPDIANNNGWTPLHAAQGTEMIHLLLDAGASTDLCMHGDGGTPLAYALSSGRHEDAELLATRGITPCNLRIAAGLGRMDLLAGMFTPSGALTVEAGSNRGFYRAHSGMPIWNQLNTPQEILDEALVWAAGNEQIEAMRYLVARGANVNANPYRSTPLTSAAFHNRAAAITTLIELGADPNLQSGFGGLTHGQGVTALHIAAQYGHREAISALLRAGASTTLKDELYNSTPAGGARYFGHEEVATMIEAHTSA